MRFRTGRLLAALGLVTVSPDVVSAARGGGRRNDNQGRTNDEAQDNPDERAKKPQNEQDSDPKHDSKASTEGQETGAKSGKSGKHDRNEERSANDERSVQNGSHGEKSRGDSTRRSGDADSSSRDTSVADADSHHGGRHVRGFAQRADEPLDDSPPDRVPDVTTVTPATPNVFIDDVPDTSINDLIVEANDNVLAGVSTSGGFAFARSGDVIAISGPDGASIVQTGDVITGTRGAIPPEPSDAGGNNNPDFLS